MFQHFHINILAGTDLQDLVDGSNSITLLPNYLVMPCISTVHFFLCSHWERVGSWKESTNLIPVWCNLYTTDHAESPPASKCYQQRRRAAREGIVFTFVCPCLHYATVFCGNLVDFCRPRHKSYLKRYSHYIYIYISLFIHFSSDT